MVCVIALVVPNWSTDVVWLCLLLIAESGLIAALFFVASPTELAQLQQLHSQEQLLVDTQVLALWILARDRERELL